jgi:hypothetical protein
MISSERGTLHDREEELMSPETIEPYDFTRLDDMYLSADEYEDAANFVCNELMELEEQAWSAVEQQTIDDVDAYLRKCVVAAWRSIELKYAERAATRRAQVSTFRQTIILDVLLRSDEVDEDFLMLASDYTRDGLLRKVSEASAPWLMKYGVQLDYDSEVGFTNAKWEIFIGATLNRST